MKAERINSPAVRTVTIQIDEELAVADEMLGLDVAVACCTGFGAELRQKRRERKWQEQNRAAIEATNAWIEKNGLPLAHLRVR